MPPNSEGFAMSDELMPPPTVPPPENSCNECDPKIPDTLYVTLVKDPEREPSSSRRRWWMLRAQDDGVSCYDRG